MQIDFRKMDAAHPPASDLLVAMEAEMLELYADSMGAMPPAGPADFTPPGGAYLVGFVDGEAVCGGGLKRLPDGAVEIKRMYVVPTARRRGAARALLVALEGAARDLGYATVRLDTGPRQPHAKALYTASGYVEVGDYNDNPYAAYWGEKRL
ncbi:MAG TPA: GNAT family N-acetyltransferase [Solirubrobacteraceae bacterium]|nr:GNAT family N-acetyltransferase [Solirubrobacteraceae bacterium]